MAQILIDGPRGAVVKVNAAETLDVSTLLSSLNGRPVTSVSIEELIYDVVAATDVQILWHATANTLCYTCSGRAQHCFKDFGGLTNNAGAGKTGDVVVAGTGSFTVILKLTKNY